MVSYTGSFGDDNPGGNGFDPSPQVLPELTEKVADQLVLEEIEDDGLLRYQAARQRGLRLGSFGIVLEPDALYEIIEHARLSPFPGVSKIFRGIINHRGNVVPVYDLSEITGVIPDSWERSRLMMLNTGQEAVALVIFELPFQITPRVPVALEEIENVPAIFLDHTRQAYRESGKLWLSLQYDTFFAALRDSCVLADASTGK
jgi:twitching motility protein PilI/purine-binding chemotaxis protein CheW